MSSSKTFFFCGIGGSGMSALALILLRRGYRILGSDRAHDQGQTPGKFLALEKLGVRLFPQDGSGVSHECAAVIVSAAVEDTIPDVRAARAQAVAVRTRADLLAELFNAAPQSISAAGTSGKSTVTGMLAVILDRVGLDPTVMNGGVMLNFMADANFGLGNMRAGVGDVFLAETDESDGSIAHYNPYVAILNNIALDHKSIEELDNLFGEFIGRASGAVVLNRDDERVLRLAEHARVPVIDFSVKNAEATLSARDIKTQPTSVSCAVFYNGDAWPLTLSVPGEHNVSNALAALGGALAMGVALPLAIKALEEFKGIRRRLEIVGSRNAITVLDDFAHNPDKIGASLRTLKEFSGRLIVMFQPHGFGPLKLMGREIAQSFVQGLDNRDLLLMPEAFYAGGTVDRSVSARDVVGWVKAGGIPAQWFAARSAILPVIAASAQPGDRIVIMGARDDTLSVFAQEVLSAL